MFNDMQVNNYFLYKHGKKIVFLLFLLSMSLIIIKSWQHHRQVKDGSAAKKFQFMLVAMSMKDAPTVKSHGKELLKYSNRTPYPRLAALILAKLAVLENDLNQAAEKLSWVVNNSNSKKDQIFHIANLRLAKILLAQNKLVEAEKLVKDQISQSHFTSLYQESLGDIWLADKKFQAANELYLKALKHLPQQAVAPWLELKVVSTEKN